eukprot:m.208349 g.208349  ORF g.208349 m.208349 type:complete len:827 (-) comp18531_c0_seq3:204-2684(-)
MAVLSACLGLLVFALLVEPCTAGLDAGSWELWVVLAGVALVASIVSVLGTVYFLRRQSRHNEVSVLDERGVGGHIGGPKNLRPLHVAEGWTNETSINGGAGEDGGSGIGTLPSTRGGTIQSVPSRSMSVRVGGGSRGQTSTDVEVFEEEGDDSGVFRTQDLAEWQVHREQVTVINEIATGTYGTVFRGQNHTSKATGHARCASAVAVKTLRNNAPEDLTQQFVREAKLLMRLNHPHIVRLVGVTVNSEPWRMLLEYAPHGELLSVVRKLKAYTAPLRPDEQLSLGAQLASGLDYLSRLGVVHRNVCLRNVLLARNNTIKLGHFRYTSLFRNPDTFDNMQRRGLLPTKWFPPEVLDNGPGSFSHASDVWSFGVALWELAADGKKPLREVPNSGLRGYLQGGQRLAKPRNCDSEFYEVMADCWAQQPKERPPFSLLWRQLSDLLDTMRDGASLEFRDIGRTIEEHEHNTAEVQGFGTGPRERKPRAPMPLPPDGPEDEPQYEDPDRVVDGGVVLPANISPLRMGPAVELGTKGQPEDVPDYSPVRSSGVYSLPNKNSTKRHSRLFETPPASADTSAIDNELTYQLPQDAVFPVPPPRPSLRRKNKQEQQEQQRVREINLALPPGTIEGDGAVTNAPAYIPAHPVHKDESEFEDAHESLQGTRDGYSDDDSDEPPPLRAISEEKQDARAIWLHPESSKKSTVKRLEAMGMEDGTFLVRSSKSKPGDRMLVVCYDGAAHNFRIKQIKREDSLLYTLDEVTEFTSLTKLVAHYSSDQSGEQLPTRLRTPCPRPDPRRSYRIEDTSASGGRDRRSMRATLDSDSSGYPLTRM